MKKIYVDIVGDLFHLGHVNLFKKARSLGDYLIVGVHADKDVEFYKRRPVLSLKERSEVIKSCRYVDYIVKYSTEDDLLAILSGLQPDVRILGTDWKDKPYTGHNMDINIHWHNRDHDYSTSNLRKRIYQAEHKKHTN